MTSMVPPPSVVGREKAPSFLYVVPMLLALVGAAGALPKAEGDTQDAALFLAEPARLMIFGSAYLLAGLLVLVRWRQSAAAASQLGLYGLLTAYTVASAAWSLYPLRVVINTAHSLGLTLVAISAAVYMAHRSVRATFVPFAVLLLPMLFASVIAAKFFPDFGLGIWKRWQGITSNPNHLGMIAVLAIWSVMMWRLAQRGFFTAVLLLGTLALAGLNLKGADSQTSILMAGGTIGLTIALTLLGRLSSMARVMGMSALLIGASAVLIVIIAAVPDLLTMPGMLAAMGRDDTLTGRTELWDLAFGLIQQKPLAGWGFDSLASALSTVQMAQGQFHNGYFDVMVRGGAIGLVLTVLLLLQAVWTGLRVYKRDWRLGTGSLVFLAALILWNMTEATLVREANELWTVFVIMLAGTRYWLLRHERAGMPRANAAPARLHAAAAAS